MKLKLINKLEKKSKILYMIGKATRYIYIYIQTIVLENQRIKRKKGYKDQRYIDLLNLKNKYLGKRCFIIATGPSLRLEDIHLLNNEYTFAMNSVCMLFDKTKWRPNIYAIQDENVYEKVEKILLNNKEGVFVSSNIQKRFPKSKIFSAFPLNSKYNYFDYRYTDKLHVKFSDDAYSMVYDAYSITFSIIQIAIYMGFKEIYLLGCDCNQKVGEKNHFIEIGHVEERQKLSTSAERNIFSHEKIKNYCSERDIKIFNATRGGALEVYPRVNLEEVLKIKDATII